MSKAGRTKQWHIMSVFNSVIKLFCYQNAHWQHVVYKNVMVSIRYHNIFKRAHTCRYARHLVARTHVWTRARMRSIYSSHTCSRASNTQWHTHYQVIHQLIGTHNVHILRETVRAEKADPTPAPQLYHSAHPTPHILKYSGPHRGPHRTGLARSQHHPATNKKSSPRWPAGCGPPRAAGRNPHPRRALELM